jgi:hypothetical protein
MGSDEEEPAATAFLDIGGLPCDECSRGSTMQTMSSPSNTGERVPDDANSSKTKVILEDTKRIDCGLFVHDSVCDGCEGGYLAVAK